MFINDKINQYIRLISDNLQEILAEQLIAREESEELFKSLQAKPLKVISGFRRSGKSSLVKLAIQKAIATKLVQAENVLYLNFEDYMLSEIVDAQDLHELLQLFNKHLAVAGPKLLVFDEIQKIQDWDKFIRTIYDRNPNHDQIIITGSNADLLSSELSSRITGRFIEFKIQPFSFTEFLSYKQIKFKNINKEYSKLESLFYDYCKQGGLPEIYSITDNNTKLSYTQSIVGKVILDDIVSRYKLRNNLAISKIFQFISQNPGKVMSYSKIVKYLKNIGIDIHQETLIEYLGYLQQCYAIYQVDKFDYSTKKIFQGSKKFYIVDVGLSHLYKGITNNFSMLLENLVYLKLKRNRNIKHIYYIAADNFEIDFVTEDWQGNIIKYQVTEQLTDDNQLRELGAFAKLDKYLAKHPNIILTLEQSNSEFCYEGQKIQHLNLIEFLLKDVQAGDFPRLEESYS